MAKETIPRKQSASQVIVMVSGGVADLIFKPAGIAVILYDYDVDGVEKTAKDPDGEHCTVAHWNKRHKVISNQHWPIIQQARTDITCHCTRRWKCPSCSRTVDLTYEELADTGFPICTDCDLEMEML